MVRCLALLCVAAAGCRTVPLDEVAGAEPLDLAATDAAADLAATPLADLGYAAGDLPAPSFATTWAMHGASSERGSLSALAGPGGSHERWSVASPGGAASPVVDGDGTVYIGGWRSLTALRPDGTTRWRRDLPLGAWSMALDGAGTLYSVEEQRWSDQMSDFALFARDAATGDPRWQLAFQSSWVAPLLVGDDGVVYCAASESVRAVGPDGKERWHNLSWGIASGIALGRDGGLVGDFWPGIGSLDAATGAERWLVKLGQSYGTRRPVIGSGGTIYSLDEGPMMAGARLIAFAPADGHRLWAADLPGVNFTIDEEPAIGPDGTIYVNGYDHYWAVRPDGVLRWVQSGLSLTNTPVVARDGTQYVSGWYGTDFLSRADAALYAFAPDGHVLWTIDGAPRAGKGDQAALGAGVIYLALTEDHQNFSLHAFGP